MTATAGDGAVPAGQPPGSVDHPPVPAGRAVAVDLGSRRIGIAVSDGAGRLAFPRPVLTRSGDPGADRRALAALVREEGARVVVVGHPVHLDGRRGTAAREAEAEARALGRELEGAGVEVVLSDERLTTVTAGRAMARAGLDTRRSRATIDSAAATVLLQAWLESR